MLYIANAISGQMWQDFPGAIIPRKITLDAARILYAREDHIWIIGHRDTGHIAARQIGGVWTGGETLDGKPLARPEVKLKEADRLLVFQNMSGRLPAGATELPKGVVFEWHLYTFISVGAIADIFHNADGPSMVEVHEAYRY